MKLFISGLPYAWSESDLLFFLHNEKAVIGLPQNIKEMKLMVDKLGKSKGWAWIVCNTDAGKRSILAKNGTVVGGSHTQELAIRVAEWDDEIKGARHDNKTR